MFSVCAQVIMCSAVGQVQPPEGFWYAIPQWNGFQRLTWFNAVDEGRIGHVGDLGSNKIVSLVWDDLNTELYGSTEDPPQWVNINTKTGRTSVIASLPAPARVLTFSRVECIVYALLDDQDFYAGSRLVVRIAMDTGAVTPVYSGPLQFANLLYVQEYLGTLTGVIAREYSGDDELFLFEPFETGAPEPTNLFTNFGWWPFFQPTIGAIWRFGDSQAQSVSYLNVQTGFWSFGGYVTGLQGTPSAVAYVPYANAVPPACDRLDANQDTAIDLSDWSHFQNCFNGPR